MSALSAQDEDIEELAQLGRKREHLSLDEVLRAYELVKRVFRALLRDADWNNNAINPLVTKFHDAGRRSAPWRQVSSRVPGRPQDATNGNRANRWELPSDHKQYAHERTATLVEIRYFLQALSMEGVPEVPAMLVHSWEWLVGHPVRPGEYRDPIQLVRLNLYDLAATVDQRREMTSGHFIPLDRGGRHEPENTFLTLRSSNSLQGNHTLDELLELLDSILLAHREIGWIPRRER